MTRLDLVLDIEKALRELGIPRAARDIARELGYRRLQDAKAEELQTVLDDLHRRLGVDRVR